MRRLFEGGVYSGAASIRVNTYTYPTFLEKNIYSGSSLEGHSRKRTTLLTALSQNLVSIPIQTLYFQFPYADDSRI